MLKASQVTRTRHAHQVTCCALYSLLHKAHAKCTSGGEKDLLEWANNKQAASSPQFLYWIRTLELQLSLLTFIRSLREGNFVMYVASLTELLTWFFCT